MASVDIQSNLSIGNVNSPSPADVSGPPASVMWGPRSDPPIDVVEASIRQLTTTNMYAFPADTPKYYMEFNISEYQRFGDGGDMFQVAKLDTISQVILPLAQNLVDVHPVAFDQTPIGAFMGNALQALAPNMRDIKNKMTAEGTPSEVMSNISDAAKQINGKNAVAAGAAVGAELLGSNAKTLATNVAGLAGYSPNQFLTILLRGPEYKRHEFRWLFSPRNDSESEALRNILIVMNNAASPGTAFGGALFTFPNVFRIAFRPNAKYLYKFKPAVLETIAVDVTGGGFPSFFRGGDATDNLNAPTTIAVTMKFLELEFWLKGDYTSDNDPFHTRLP